MRKLRLSGKQSKYLSISMYVLCDLITVFLANLITIALVFSITQFGTELGNIKWYLLFSMVVYVASICVSKSYNVLWRYCSEIEGLKLVICLLFSAFFSICFAMITFHDLTYIKLALFANVFASVLIVGLRLAVRIGYKLAKRSRIQGGKSKRLLIIGAGELATILLKDIETNENLNYNVIGLIDDDISKFNRTVHGHTVLGDRKDIKTICQTREIDEIIFAISTLNAKDKAEILNLCSDACKNVKVIDSIENYLQDRGSSKNIRSVAIEDLLGRESVVLDNKLIKGDIFDKTVLVTGGGGSIGSELCRQILKFDPKTLIILDVYENTTYDIQNELCEKYPNKNIVVLIASVRDKKRLDEIFAEYKPDLVFHAAAHKHVPLMEYSPGEAIKNNVFGTYNTAKCASKHGVKKFVMISTDKAVNPTNVMGASKRMCEMIIQTIQQISKTEFALVRFGNVLGSNGSVIPRFKKQIEAGGPVTVTHPEITRFFMTIPEAAQLVLQAASYAKGGEIFVLDMGSPVKISELAKRLIKLSGFVPDVDIKIEYTGLRKGEKLYEELLMSEEGLQKTAHSKIFVAKPIDITKEILDEKLKILESAEYGDINTIKRAVAEVVPTYKASLDNE